jgi:hypothetical protein
VVTVAKEEAGVDSGGGKGGGQRRRRWWCRRRPASTVVVATGEVESDDDLKSFRMKNKMIRGRLLFISLKPSITVLT